MLSSADDLMSEKDWVSVHDPTSGRVYYSNTKTNETRWTLPSSVIEQGPWKKYNDPRTGRDYYYNINTKETRWELTLHAKTISDCISSCESDLEAPYLPEDLRKEIHLFRDRAHTKHYFSKKTSGDRTSELFSTDAKDKRKLRRLSANSLQHFVRERLSSKGQPANVSLASLHSTSSISERAEQTILDEYLLLEDLRKSSEVDEIIELDIISQLTGKLVQKIRELTMGCDHLPGQKQDRCETFEWFEFIDDISGRAYYYNVVTQETTWEQPVAFKSRAP